MKALVTMVMMVFMMMACGAATDPQGYQTASEKEAADKAAQQQQAGSAGLSNPSDYFEVTGYVSPIGIAVDGTVYKDSEDFYTQEVNRLNAQVKSQYPGYKLTFDAAVGLRNFKTGMYVFLVATSDVGVASETYVDSSGKFTFMLESKVDRKAEYTLRATKRIGLTLSKKGEETISWCYNMYAEKNVALDGKSNVLRNFSTSVTEYQCSEQGEGITVPEADFQNETDEIAAKQAKTESDRDVALNKAIAEAEEEMNGKSAIKNKEDETEEEKE